MNVTERFLDYVAYDTQSDPACGGCPSTEKQKSLGRRLAADMEALGMTGVRMDEHGYVYGTVPANVEGAPVFGLLAHMDTTPDFTGAGVKPRVVRGYDGGEIVLNEALGIAMGPDAFPELAGYKGQDLIVTDGTTLLGADDKAGAAEILTMAERLLADPSLPHGEIRVAFTPDEEIGRGPDRFDIPGFGAEFAYTVDGGALGEVEYENFNGASAEVELRGLAIHPGSARGRLVNASLLAMEFQAMLPVHQAPEATDGREGFFHLHGMQGDVESARLSYILRDHDWDKLTRKKALLREAAAYLNRKYGEGTAAVRVEDSYRNMKEKLLPDHADALEYALAAMRAEGVEPVCPPIRGGTDGARLSWEGLPCPNLCTGGHNAHGRYEYVPVQSMEKIVDVLVRLAGLVAEGKR